jgi:penicillin-binding protein 1A
MNSGRLLVCIGGFAAVVAVASYRVAAEIATVADGITLDSAPQATIVLDAHDRPVFTFYQEERTSVPLGRVSSHMVAAILAIEDRRFYRHRGVDPFRVIGAAWADVRARRVAQGGSTITQQLVRLAALTPERTFGRKIREMLLAVAAERRFSKSEILEAYLNKVYFGDGYYGIQAAARGYFGKDADELTVAEAATLAGVIRSPSTYAPREAPARARSRRNLVLRAMRDAGSLTAAEYRRLQVLPLSVQSRDHDEYARTDDPTRGDGFCGLYFKEEIRRQLLRRFGPDRLYQGGLRVFATIDPRLQTAAERAVGQRIRELEAAKAFQRLAHDQMLEGSLVSVDPATGHVLALVGGRDFHESRFDRVTQARRQPGSAFKPLLFAAALERGYSPGTLLENLTAPVSATGGSWLPRDEHEASAYTLRRALTVSSNRAAAQLMQAVGISSTIEYARRLGIASTLPAVPSLALGTGEVTLLELTSAYATFANRGLRIDPVLIRRVEDRSGNLLWETPAVAGHAVSSQTAFLMSSMLSDVIQLGTGSRARALGFTLPAAGKTGTTDNFLDTWFVGYTPRLVAGVWFGFDAPSRIMNQGFAATVAVPAWTTFMKQATERDKPQWFQQPSGIERVTLCRVSGQRATDACRRAADQANDTVSPIEGEASLPSAATTAAGVYDEYVLIGSAPAQPCPIHGSPIEAPAAPYDTALKIGARLGWPPPPNSPSQAIQIFSGSVQR